MKILILNKNEASFQHAISYQILLEGEGHSVDLHRTLSEIGDSKEKIDNYVADFDFAVVHPNFSDAAVLKKEVERRDNFRVIFYNVKGPPEYDGRVIYRDLLDFRQLDRIVSFEKEKTCRV